MADYSYKGRLTVKKILRHDPLSTLFAILALAGAAFLGSVANAAPPTTICPSGEGTFCDLTISAPESVAQGQPFTVKVGITDFAGNLVPPNDRCASKVVVTLRVYIFESLFATYTANASRGVATFNVGGLPPNEGPYSAELKASAVQTSGPCNYQTESEFVTVVTVQPGQPIAPCPNDVPCTQTTSGSGSAATLFANSTTDDGTFIANFVAKVDNCGGGGPRDLNGVLDFSYSGSATKTIIIALSPDLVTKGIGRYNICWKPDTASTGFYLSSCNHSAPPCVDSKTSGQHNSAFFTILAPSGDPQVYPE